MFPTAVTSLALQVRYTKLPGVAVSHTLAQRAERGARTLTCGNEPARHLHRLPDLLPVEDYPRPHTAAQVPGRPTPSAFIEAADEDHRHKLLVLLDALSELMVLHRKHRALLASGKAW